MNDAIDTARSRTAFKLIQFYGSGAEKEAADQAETCVRRGDIVGSQTWSWIANMISGLQPQQEVPKAALSINTAALL